MLPTGSTVAHYASMASSALADPSAVATLPVNLYALVPFALFIAAFMMLGIAVEAVHRTPPTRGPQGGHLGSPLDAAA